VDEAVALGGGPGAEAGGQGGVDGLLELAGEGFALGGEVDAADPAVVGVGLTGDQVASLKPVDQAGDVGLVAVQQGGQLAEGGLRMLGEAQQLCLLGGQSQLAACCAEQAVDLQEDADQRLDECVI